MRDSDDHKQLLRSLHDDLRKSRSVASCVAQQQLSSQPEHVRAHLVDLLNTDMATTLKNVDVPKHFQQLMDSLPKDKRLEVVYSRSAEDRQIRGVKQTLHKKELRNQSEEDFHERYGHMGSGKKCILCHLVKGSMRFIYSVVDKYIETRMGYFFDMDTLTVSHRASCGTKYYTCMRDRGSKTIKEFPLVFRSDFVDQFDAWLTRQRADPLYTVFN